MSRRKNKRTDFPNGLQVYDNDVVYKHYFDWLCEIALSLFEWHDLPTMVVPRYLEWTLFSQGNALFIPIPDLDNYVAVQSTYSGLNYANDPVNYYPFVPNREINGKDLIGTRYDSSNAVMIWNNYRRYATFPSLEWYAKRLTDLTGIIKTNIHAQRTPKIVSGTSQQKLSLINLLKQLEDNDDVIPVYDNGKDLANIDEQIHVFDISAPYVADSLEMEKQKIWNEAMTYIGVNNTNVDKKERVQTSEVDANNSQVTASRNRYLSSRQDACRKINEKFDLNVSVTMRDKSYYEDLLDLSKNDEMLPTSLMKEDEK